VLKSRTQKESEDSIKAFGSANTEIVSLVKKSYLKTSSKIVCFQIIKI